MSEMTDKEFQGVAKEAARSIFMNALTELAEKVPGAKAEELVKIINSTVKDVAGAVPEKKIDPNANLPLVSVTIVNGSLQVTAQPAPVMEVVEEVQPPRLIETKPAAPTKKKKPKAAPPPAEQSLDELLASIDVA